ncbi:MAG TPA: hypothetical protein VFU34_08200, partial [Gaiellaceae bacterium]|nr:hypothetical protein [Gaiellaceae bacterium]
MRVAVPRETAPGERRVALVPETVSKLRAMGFEVAVERDAGTNAGFSDGEYVDAGAELRDVATSGAECVARVTRPSAEDVETMQPGTVLIGFLDPL